MNPLARIVPGLTVMASGGASAQPGRITGSGAKLGAIGLP